MTRTGEGIREGWSRGWSVFGRRAAAALSANVSRHVVFTAKANVFYFGAALIGSLMGTLLLARYSWFWSPFNADSMVVVGVVLTAGTLALASVAGGIALVAYVTVARPPTLRVTVRSLIWPVDQPEIVYDPRAVRAPDNLSADGALEYERDVIRNSGLTGLDIAGELTIRIQNTSQFSARSPACRVSTYGFRVFIGSAVLRATHGRVLGREKELMIACSGMEAPTSSFTAIGPATSICQRIAP